MIRCGMLDLCGLVVAHVIDLFRPRAAIGNQILVLWQQIIVLRQGRPGRVPLLAADRMVLGWVYRLFPKTREALAAVIFGFSHIGQSADEDDASAVIRGVRIILALAFALN
jgi:hypothetical protein